VFFKALDLFKISLNSSGTELAQYPVQMKKVAITVTEKSAESSMNKGVQRKLTDQVSKNLRDGKPTLSIH